MTFYQECLSSFQEITKKPTHFLQCDEDICNEMKTILKSIYDYNKSQEIKHVKGNALSALVVQNFDLEQIWQQIELQNDSVVNHQLTTTISKLLVSSNRSQLSFTNKKESKEDKTEEEAPPNIEPDDEDEIGSADDMEKSSEEEEDFDDIRDSDNERKSPETERTVKQSIVDDQFFKLNEMEHFLKTEEQKLENPDSGNDSEESEEESVDLFDAEVDDSEDEEQAKYDDFFVANDIPKIQKNKHLREIEEEEEQEPESTHERKLKRVKQKIAAIEEEAIEEKPWQLKGEITADSRPQNSLLQEVVEFDLTTRPAPVMTEVTSLKLEDIIKQRIKDKVYDSVERKSKPADTPLEYKKKLVLEQEKSKESLAQIYEKEFLEQQSLKENNGEKEEEETPALHNEINSLMKNLFMKLDALSNFHFTPKPAIPELKVISNLPAIAMEEVAPVAASDAALLAPEEIQKKDKGDLMGKNERTGADKKRERRKKKSKQKSHAKRKEKQTDLGQKRQKETKNKKKTKNVTQVSGDKALKSSKAFFTKLEEEVKAGIKRKSVNNVDKKNVISAKKFKL